MKLPCPHCGALAIREGASKCPACKSWVGPKPRYPLGVGGVLAVSLGLISMGAVAGGIGTCVALSGHAAATPVSSPQPPPTSSASSGAASPADSASAAPRASASAESAAPPAPFGEPRTLKVEFAPVDAIVTDDDKALVVLADDGGLHVLALDDGHELKKVSLAGRATELRLLSAGRVALLGAAGALHLIDLSSGVVQKLDVGGAAVDALEVGDPPLLIVASSSRRLSRFSNALKPEGQVTLARPVVGLVALESQGKELAAVLEQGRRGGPAGAIELFDALATPFAGARTSIPVGFEPRRGAQHPKGATLLVADKATAQLSEISPERPMRSAGVGRSPFAAFRVGERWAVTLDAAGTASLSDTSAASLEATKTVALGGAISRAASTPDGRALFVALGGGAKERGATTVVLAGDPPALAGKFATGAGSHAVSVSRSGKFAVVAAYWARTLTVLSAR